MEKMVKFGYKHNFNRNIIIWRGYETKEND